jgi:hypothetical protein
MDSLLRPWRSVHDGNRGFESSGARPQRPLGVVKSTTFTLMKVVFLIPIA